MAKRPPDPPVLITGIRLSRIGDHVLVFAQFPDGSEIEVIREYHDCYFSHYVSESGIKAAVKAAKQP